MSDLRSVLSMILNALDRDAEDGKAARGEMAEELRAVLAQEAGKVEPVAQVVNHTSRDMCKVNIQNVKLLRAVPDGTLLYTSPPVPAAVVLPNRNEVHLKHPLRMDVTELVQVWNACIDLVEELNQ